MIIRCDAPTTGVVVGRGDAIAGAGMMGAGVLVPSGGTLDALPMPLGSLSTLGLAGPNGTPLIGELPAPADPAGGVSCAYALPGATKLPSSRTRTSAELRNIDLSGAASPTIMWGPARGDQCAVRPKGGR